MQGKWNAAVRARDKRRGGQHERNGRQKPAPRAYRVAEAGVKKVGGDLPRQVVLALTKVLRLKARHFSILTEKLERFECGYYHSVNKKLYALNSWHL